MTKDTKIALLGAITGIVALAFSLFQSFDTNREKIIAFSNNQISLKNEGVRVDQNLGFTSISIPIKIIISNNSKHPISIIDYKCYTTYNNEDIIFSPFADSLNREDTKADFNLFPINLNSFESRNVSMFVEIYLNNHVSNLLFDETKQNKPGVKFFAVGTHYDSILTSKKIDILGNSIEINKPTGEYRNRQSLHIEFISSTGNKFLATILL